MGDPIDKPQELDVTGLQCPLPVLKAQKVLRDMAIGAELVVLATDPAANIDLPHYCNQSGNSLIETDQSQGVFRFRIRKTAED